MVVICLVLQCRLFHSVAGVCSCGHNLQNRTMLGLFCPSQAYADVVMIYDNQATNGLFCPSQAYADVVMIYRIELCLVCFVLRRRMQMWS